jgi:hypothetical protein
MVNLLTRDQALANLKQFDGLTVREFTPDESYGFGVKKGNYVYTFGDKNDYLEVAPGAWDHVYRNTGLKGGALATLPPELHQEHVVPIVDHKFRTAERELKALVKEDKIVGFAKGEVQTQNPRDLMFIAEKVLGKKNVRGYQAYGGFERSYVTLVGNDERKLGKTFDRDSKRVGALAGFGVTTFTSPLGLSSPGGNHSLELNGFNWILQCTNGAVSTNQVAHYTHRTAGDIPFIEWYPDAVRTIYNQAEVEYDRLKSLQDVKLPDYTAEMLDGMMEQYGVPPLIRGKVADRLINLPVHDLLGVWQHITYVASNYSKVVEDPMLVRRLQLSAASIASNQHICNSCHQLIKPRKRLNQEVKEVVEEATKREARATQDRNN